MRYKGERERQDTERGRGRRKESVWKEAVGERSEGLEEAG